MLQQADDFREESQALFDLLADLDSDSFTRATQFKDWTVNDVIRHLHVWNVAADLSLTDESEFARFLEQVSVADGLREFEPNWLGGSLARSCWKPGGTSSSKCLSGLCRRIQNVG